MLSEEETLLRLLEITALLLPVVAILLQVTIRLYTSEETTDKISNKNKRRTTVYASLALILLIISAIVIVSSLLFAGLPIGEFEALLLLTLALVLIGYSVTTVGIDSIEAFSETDRKGRIDRRISAIVEAVRSSGRIKRIRRVVATRIHPDLPEQEDDENGRK